MVQRRAPGGGRRPKPTAAKILQGTFRKDRANAAEPQIRVAAPSPPEWLSDVARAEWRRIVPQLVKLKLIGCVDRAALVTYCTAWADLVDAEAQVAVHGSTLADLRTWRTYLNPNVGRAHRARQVLIRSSAEFGFTPSSRTKVTMLSDATPKGPSAKDRFFGPTKPA